MPWRMPRDAASSICKSGHNEVSRIVRVTIGYTRRANDAVAYGVECSRKVAPRRNLEPLPQTRQYGPWERSQGYTRSNAYSEKENDPRNRRPQPGAGVIHAHGDQGFGRRGAERRERGSTRLRRGDPARLGLGQGPAAAREDDGDIRVKSAISSRAAIRIDVGVRHSTAGAPVAGIKTAMRNLSRPANASRCVTFCTLLRSPQLSGQHFS